MRAHDSSGLEKSSKSDAHYYRVLIKEPPHNLRTERHRLVSQSARLACQHNHCDNDKSIKTQL